MTTRVLFIAFTLICPSLMMGCEIAMNMLLIGKPFREVRVGRLNHPVQVRGWDSDGLILAGPPGYVRLRGLGPLPAQSAILREATKRGVELTGDGRVVALVKIQHWCGNDPVGLEIARVDLASVLRFIDSAVAACRSEGRRASCPDHSAVVGQDGWMAGEFWAYKQWLKDPSLPPRRLGY